MIKYDLKLRGWTTKSDGLISFILNGFGLTLLFAQQIVFARVLGVIDFGIYSFIQSIFAMSTVFTTWGMGTLSFREIGSINDLGLKKGFYLFSHLFIMILNVIMGIVMYNYSPNLGSLNDLVDIRNIFLFATVYFYLKSFIEVLSIQHQAEGHTIVSKLSSHIIPILSSTLVVLIGYKYFGKINLIFFLVLISSATLGSIFCILILKKPGYFIKEKIKMTFEFKSWIKSGLFLMLLSGLYIILGRMNNFVIGIYLEPQYVGYYSVCLSLSALVLFGLNSINQVIAPKIAKSFKESNLINFQKLLLKSTKIGFLTTLFFIVMMILFGHLILGFFGDEFKEFYHMIWIALKTFTQFWVLSSYTYWTSIHMAFTHHDTTLYNERSCGDPPFFCT